MFFPDHEFLPSRIPDSVTATNYKREGEHFFYFVSHKFHKIDNYPRSQIPDPTTATKDEGVEFVVLFCSG
jgi:hypothetical protein